MWRNLILLLAVVGSLLFLLFPVLPLGIPGEWEWTRQRLPQDITEAFDRLVPSLLAGAVLLAFCRLGDRQFANGHSWTRVLLLTFLVAGSYAWQTAVRQCAASPHRELRPLWILYDKYASGYFFEAAFVSTSPRELLATYEARMAKGDVLHEGTHPPGLFLFNQWALIATENSSALTSFAEWTQSAETLRMFRSAESQAGMSRPMGRTELAALCLVSFVSSVLSSMTVLPVYGIVRLLSDRTAAWRAACLTVTIPCIAVFAPRSDVVYAFSGTLLLWLFIRSMLSKSLTGRISFAVITGLWMTICLATSLAHLPVLVAATLFASVMLLERGLENRRSILISGVFMLSVFFALITSFDFLTDCSLLKVWKMNLTNHSAFYGTSPRTWWKWMLVNPLELSLSIGLPLAMMVALTFQAFAKDVVSSWRLNRSEKSNTDHSHQMFAFRALLFSLLATWTALWLSGKNMGEAARLWCFLTPWFPMIVSFRWAKNLSSGTQSKPFFQRSGDSSYDRQGWLALLAAQLIVALVTVGRVSGYSLLDVS